LTLDPLSPAGQAAILAALPTMSLADKEALLADLEALEHSRALDRYRGNFLAFCHHVYPEFKEGPHHRNMAKHLAEVIFGDRNRLTVSMPPRFGKSITIAYLFVAWYLGHNPSHHIMMVTHTADLSADFGRQVRNLLSSPVYREIFPATVVSADKSAANNWATTAGGKYLAIGIGANVAGHGAHLLVADDLVSEQAVLANPDTIFATAWNYMQVGPMQRLMPNGRIVMIGTRWGKKDPIGRALQWAEQNTDSPQWYEIRFPAILPSGKSLWPEQWPVEQLLAKRASMFPQFWAAQYMQEPTSEEGAIIKREWWREWTADKPPKCHVILQSWDTAHETKTSADPSAVTTWGLFINEEEQDQEQIILLDAWYGRKEFPELKKFALEYYKEWEPDMVIIEKKAAGAPLIQELRMIGIPVMEYSPSRKGAGVANDKRARGNAIADIFASKMVWAPPHRWAREVIDQVASFPNAEHDDLYDTVVQAMMRIRQGGFLRLASDDRSGEDDMLYRRPVNYY
jgi:predicted phage terminase large subunit-like protein